MSDHQKLTKLPLSFNACDGSSFWIVESRHAIGKVDAYVKHNDNIRVIVTNGRLCDAVSYKSTFLLARKDFKLISDSFYKCNSKRGE